MAFVQVIDFRTGKIDEARALVQDYLAKTEGRRTARRSLLCEDRDNPGRYLNIVSFDSYESAMENSKLPETQELAAGLAALVDGEQIFINLEVIEEVVSGS